MPTALKGTATHLAGNVTVAAIVTALNVATDQNAPKVEQEPSATKVGLSLVRNADLVLIGSNVATDQNVLTVPTVDRVRSGLKAKHAQTVLIVDLGPTDLIDLNAANAHRVVSDQTDQTDLIAQNATEMVADRAAKADRVALSRALVSLKVTALDSAKAATSVAEARIVTVWLPPSVTELLTV